MRYLSEERGFTLLELMVTMIILSILVGIVVATMALTQQRAEQSACKMNLRVIFDAITQYNVIHTGEYPADLDVLVDEGYVKKNFSWQCPSGDDGTLSGDYRTYYDSLTGHTSCPRPNHNP